ncbi:Uncharacterised protein [Mannheimia haemolytica]|uniref:Phosphatase YniC n=1 Tax=Mannheimia haemolytica TaxID=75985 RepID=A0A378N1Y7_MANHA|nr:Uncharacterised protein [Mannheimia haemolytica]
MLQAIIFDMDGVIVDTEYLEFSLQKQFIEDIKEHSRPITLEQQSEVVGKCLKRNSGDYQKTKRIQFAD